MGEYGKFNPNRRLFILYYPYYASYALVATVTVDGSCSVWMDWEERGDSIALIFLSYFLDGVGWIEGT